MSIQAVHPVEEPSVDDEWIQLMCLARQLGLVKDDIRSLIQQHNLSTQPSLKSVVAVRHIP